MSATCPVAHCHNMIAAIADGRMSDTANQNKNKRSQKGLFGMIVRLKEAAISSKVML